MRTVWSGHVYQPGLVVMQEGTCVRGDNCPYAHNVFEYWLHPTRYVELCFTPSYPCHICQLVRF